MWAARIAAVVVVLLVLALATVLPFRFVYPNLAPRPWRGPLLSGAAIWSLLLIAMLPSYPHPPAWMYWLSLIYPLAYTALSFYLDVQTRRRR